jgi:hypothetical protein
MVDIEDWPSPGNRMLNPIEIGPFWETGVLAPLTQDAKMANECPIHLISFVAFLN